MFIIPITLQILYIIIQSAREMDAVRNVTVAEVHVIQTLESVNVLPTRKVTSVNMVRKLKLSGCFRVSMSFSLFFNVPLELNVPFIKLNVI